MNKGCILYYAVSPVHLKNLRLVANCLQNWDFALAYEPDPWWMSDELLDSVKYPKIALSRNFFHLLESHSFKAVVFSTLQPRKAVLDLLRWTYEKELPSIAVEETNQFALNSGSISNYMLPVDHLFVSSSYEYQSFVIDENLPKSRVQITGWPFYDGPEIFSLNERKGHKILLGLDPERPVATLTLTAFGDAGETQSVRCKQLRMAEVGLDDSYQLIVKPHPIEKMAVLQKFVNEHAPSAKIIDGNVPINDVLSATDVLLNRGVSQVAFEALIRQIPVVVLNCGDITPFHLSAKKIIANDESDLRFIIDLFKNTPDPLKYFRDFLKQHMPYLPFEARHLTCQRVEEVANGGLRGDDLSSQILDLALFYAWKVSRKEARNILVLLNENKTINNQVYSFKKLMDWDASKDDIVLLRKWWGNGYRGQILNCVWIDYARNRRIKLVQEDIDWMQFFPSKINTHLFYEHCLTWGLLLVDIDQIKLAQIYAEKLRSTFENNEQIAACLRDLTCYMDGGLHRSQYMLRSSVRTIRLYARQLLNVIFNR